MTTPEVLLQYVTLNFLVAPLPEHIVTIPYGNIYIPVTYPSSQMLGLGFLRPTLHGNWLVKAMWEICLNLFSRANYIAVDIETNKELLAIEMCWLLWYLV